MRVVKHISFALLSLMLAVSAAAQMRNPPPASIYSVGGTTLGGPPASIYSLPSRPVGVGRTCCAIGINIGPRHHPGGHRPVNGGFVGYPAYYPIYPYYGYAEVEQPSESLPNAGTFDRPRNPENADPESRPRTDRAPAPADDSRYGEHYLDSRDARPATPPAPAPEPTPALATLLVFRDGRRLEVQNYAIMGTTLFVLTPERHKIPLSDLDLQATARENDDRGVDFHVPSVAE